MTIYPDLELRPPELRESPHNFRLNKISQIDSFLEREANVRRGLAKKYERAYNVLDGALYGCGVVGAGLETTGISLAVTGIGIIPGAVLGGVGLLCFVLELPFLALQRSFLKKLRKHEAVAVTADANRKSVHDLVASALRDGVITEEEFKNIVGQLEKCNASKAEIRKPLVKREKEELPKYDEIKKCCRLHGFRPLSKIFQIQKCNQD